MATQDKSSITTDKSSRISGELVDCKKLMI